MPYESGSIAVGIFNLNTVYKSVGSLHVLASLSPEVTQPTYPLEDGWAPDQVRRFCRSE